VEVDTPSAAAWLTLATELGYDVAGGRHEHPGVRPTIRLGCEEPVEVHRCIPAGPLGSITVLVPFTIWPVMSSTSRAMISSCSAWSGRSTRSGWLRSASKSAAGRCIRTAASTPQVDHVDD
jgi:hypothetical protein